MTLTQQQAEERLNGLMMGVASGTTTPEAVTAFLVANQGILSVPVYNEATTAIASGKLASSYKAVKPSVTVGGTSSVMGNSGPDIIPPAYNRVQPHVTAQAGGANQMSDEELAVQAEDTVAKQAALKLHNEENPYNSVLGDADTFSVKGALGGYTEMDNGAMVKSSGWVDPAYNITMGLYKANELRKQNEEVAENNAKQIALKNEALKLTGIKQRNRIAQMRRYAAIGMGNANSRGTYVRAALNNPYQEFNPTRIA